jgi:hypothetical protein
MQEHLIKKSYDAMYLRNTVTCEIGVRLDTNKLYLSQDASVGTSIIMASCFYPC